MDLATTRPDFPPAAPSRAWLGSSLRAGRLKDVLPLFAVFVLALAAAIAPAPAGAAEFFLADEPEVYAAIDKLNASGALPGFLANTRPYSVRAVREAAAAALRGSRPVDFDVELLRWVAYYAAQKQTARVTLATSHSDDRFTPANNEGIPTPKGWAGQASIAAREDSRPNVSAHLRALSFYGEGGDDGNRLLDAALETGHRYASLQVGKISAWYGPGRHGALILTNNASPYPGVRLHNPEPIPLTGWFSFLGSVQYDLFVARMDKKPLYSHSMFVGTRLAARPAGWLEVGLTRVLHYGGEGRSNGLSEFFTDYAGNNNPSDRSNTLAGYDITLTLPFRAQPVQAYWDRAGEGDNHLLGTGIPWPSQWGNILGLYFPSVLTVSRLDLRAEYADNYSGYAKSANWYSHGAYPHFYRGNVLGHSMGGNARDWFVETRCFLLPSSYASATWERVMHDGAPVKGERHNIFGAGLVGWLTNTWRAEVRASMDRVSTQGGVPGVDGTDFSAFLSVAYQAEGR